MGRTCAVITCSRNQDENISFFKVRKDAQWLKFLQSANADFAWEPVEPMYLCQSHFQTDFIRQGVHPRIHPNGYPSLLDGICVFSNNDMPATQFEVEVSHEAVVSSDSQSGEPKPNGKTSKKLDELMKTNERLAAEVDKLKKSLEEAREVIRVLRQGKKRSAEQKRKATEDKLAAKRVKLEESTPEETAKKTDTTVLEELEKRTHQRSNAPYSDTLKEFSFQLHYYSPRAYSFSRQNLHNLKLLPHESTLNCWTSHIHTEPGLLQTSLQFLKKKNEESDHPILYAASCDEMYIRKCIIHNSNGILGHIDYGDIMETPDNDKEATTALFVMVTAINSDHRVPVGYILTNGLTADVLAAFLEKVMIAMNEVNARVLTLTFDGLGSNMKAAEKLGANLDVASEDVRPFVLHPSTKKKVHVLLDAVHMLKLLRNHWNKNKILFDADDNEIRWEYISKLQNLQQDCGLKVANKLSNRHVHFHRQKMKANLCVQTMSNSVSVALGVCNELNIPGFEDTKPTEIFLAKVNRLFDALNSKSNGKGFTSPISATNKEMYKEILTDSMNYLKSLKIRTAHDKKEPLLDTRARTAIKGLIITISSVLAIADEMVGNPNEPLIYLPTYKLSQDLIEMFFSTIRSRFGYNNNPNALQLQHALRGILCMKTRSINTGNCFEQEEISMKVSPLGKLSNIVDGCCYSDEIVLHEDEKDEENGIVELEVVSPELASLMGNVVAYIAGFVIRKISKRSKCSQCICKLVSSEEDWEEIKEDCVLINSRNNGGLIYPSRTLLSICKLTEETVRKEQAKGIKRMKKDSIVNNVLLGCTERRYAEHFDCSGNSHSSRYPMDLIKDIISLYVTTRMHHIAKERTLKLCPTTVRSTCTNITQFNGN